MGSPAQIPGAIITVLYRPLIFEASGMAQLASALEGTILLGITIWKFPTLWRRKRLLREKAMLMMAFFYTGGFIIGFSAILNLGILARQRVQVFPLFLLVLVGLGWDATRPRRKPSRHRHEPEEPAIADEGDGRDEKVLHEVRVPQLSAEPDSEESPSSEEPPSGDGK